MTISEYRNEINCLCPVALKLNQSDVRAPHHNQWRVVKCCSCGEEFGIGPNRIFGSRKSEQVCVGELEAILAQDHTAKQPHANYYQIPD